MSFSGYKAFKRNFCNLPAAGCTFLLEKAAEDFSGHSPGFSVKAILDFWRLNLSLYQIGFFKLFEMLRQSGFGYRKYFRQVAAIAA
jgi:hypothetical protein